MRVSTLFQRQQRQQLESSSGRQCPMLSWPKNVLVLTDEAVPNFYLQEAIDAGEEDPAARLGGEIHGKPVTIVKLRGKTKPRRHGHSAITARNTSTTMRRCRKPACGSPSIRDCELGLQTDETGWWTCRSSRMPVLIWSSHFVFEKLDWITLKTNINTINDEDNIDFAIQFIDPYFYEFGMLPLVEGMIRENGYPNFFFKNAIDLSPWANPAGQHARRSIAARRPRRDGECKARVRRLHWPHLLQQKRK
ncbi:MAG: hypothetical protein IPG06_12980 [Haliea sp.]|nr:hypothetical protein [Haliea sp.]